MNKGLVLLALIAILFTWPGAAPAGDKAPGSTPPTAANPDSPSASFRFPIFHFPDRLTLCGEEVPLDNPWVFEMLDREFQVNVYDTAQVVMWAKRAGRWFPAIEKALKKAGMPDDLKYLAVAESALKEWAYSPAGAAGPWQFIRSTGRRYGLRRNTSFDDRMDFDKATKAALAYLSELHGMFGSWTLAMAAYNCGEIRVAKEITEQGVDSYFLLNLPRETERYIFRILTAKIILSNPQAYGYDFSRVHIYPPREVEMVTIRASGRIHIRHLAQAAGTRYKVIKELNPNLRKYHLPPGIHRVKVPAGQAAGFNKRLAKVLKDAPRTKVVSRKPVAKPKPVRKKVYVVKKGDNLTRIASRLNVSVAYLKRTNKLRKDTIHVGQKLKY